MRTKTTFGILMIMALPVLAQDKGWFAQETAKDYRIRARFPESSHALAPGEKDPVKEKRTATHQSARGPEGKGAALAIWAGSVSYEVGRPVTLFATVEGSIGNGALEVSADVVGEAGDLVAHVDYNDQGRGGDHKAGDGVWTARFRMPAGVEPEVAASYMVKVRSRLSDGDVRETVGGFLYSNPGAHLTGRYRDALRDGSLVVSAEVDVARAGRFHLAGTLYSQKGEPVGTAQAAAELEPGRQWIDLTFYGLMFHDRQVAGPFRLGTVALTTAGSMPNALNDLVENAYVTRAWRLDQMTAKPFANVILLDAAARLEAAASQ
ncbi:MAG TPA: hypothetical protein VH394_16965 [Thermoanaerobaculia bacterium]|jgi:hypothetical protein|nr:hypothetical protein [Thermoanaerobaculia bacterium]